MKTSGLLALLVVLAFTVPTYAQGGGASSTGTIQGRISDPQGALLAGVTVTATSPSALGVQTTISSETGNYRFPAIPPGTYELTYALAGFKTLKRTGIINTLGFTTNLNVALALAIMEETVTVNGDSPIIDTSATSVVQVFKLDQLQSLPGRDMWALLAATPGVGVARIDVGGNRAGQATAYSAYGLTGQVRVLVDGINPTEGTGGAGSIRPKPESSVIRASLCLPVSDQEVRSDHEPDIHGRLEGSGGTFGQGSGGARRAADRIPRRRA